MDQAVRYSFNVDLGGLVDLLSRHLYSSPRVYVRELLQNGVDAINARRALDPGALARLTLEPPEVTGDDTLRVHDTGIGLSEPQVHEFLATIGRSAKHDDLGFARSEFLGQFGIGLLSCFLVADEIEVVTRSAEHDAPTVVWRGHASGHYTVDSGPPRAEPGTTVVLRPRRGAAHWLSGDTVRELARHYGRFLDTDVRVAGTGTGTPVTGAGPPWLAGATTPARREDLLAYGTTILGTTPLDVIELRVAEAGLTGVAFVQPHEVHPGQRGNHHVYLKRMLLSDHVEGLLPDWAFFVRCVVDTTELRPTASREGLYEDDLLATTREALGEQIRDWMVALSTTSATRLRALLETHHRGALALALHDDAMLRLVDAWVPLETNQGWLTPAELRQRRDTIRYTPTTEEFGELGPVAAAQGIEVVNGGVQYTTDILRRLTVPHPELTVRPLDAGELADAFDPVDPTAEPAVAGFLATAGPPLRRLGCEPAVRAFDPPSLPALYLDSINRWVEVDAAQARAAADDAWAAMLEPVPEPSAPPMPTLVFNHRNPLARRLMYLDDPSLVELAVEALHGQALLTGHRPLGPSDTAALQRAFLGLLERAIDD